MGRLTIDEAIKVLKQPCYCDYDLSATIEDCEVSSCNRRDAMKLVINALEKQGGVSDYVCEWIKYDYRTICPRNHDIGNPYWRIPDNMDKLKYCPYCGKKIKVV